MPLYSFICGACGAFTSHRTIFHHATIKTPYAALYGVQHIHAGYTQAANIIPPKRIISHLAPVCPAAPCVLLHNFICACENSFTVCRCKSLPAYKNTLCDFTGIHNIHAGYMQPVKNIPPKMKHIKAPRQYTPPPVAGCRRAA